MSIFKSTPKITQKPHKSSFFDFFPTPKFLEMPAPGLSISDRGAHLMDFSHDKEGLRVKRFADLTFPDRYIVDGEIKNRDALIEALSNFRKENDLKYVRVSLPEERAYLFSTTISSAQAENIRTSIEFIIEENVPLSVSEVVFDYNIIPTKEKHDDHIRISVSVVPESVVEEYLGILRSAGLEPLHFEVESQAIAKAVIPNKDTSVSVIANINHDKVGLYICDGGAVSFTSTFPISNSTEKESVASSEKILVDISTELKKIFMYWQTQADHLDIKPEPISRIILTGDDAGRFKELSLLTKTFSVPVIEANVWQNTFSLDKYIPEIPKERSLSFATAVGLAMPRRLQ
jgi:hypothetical protein